MEKKTEIHELIGGLLRKGEKMLFTGPRFAGKSQLLIQLAVAFATGTEWIGFPCAKSRVFYVNTQLDAASCMKRFQEVSGKRELSGEVWNESNVKAFCELLDRICRETDAAVICCATDPKPYPECASLQDYKIGSDLFGAEGDCFLHLAPIRFIPGEASSLWRLEGGKNDDSPIDPVELRFAWPVHNVDSGKET